MLRLEGKNVLITGASSGIGQAIAVRFAKEGANVAINFRNGPGQAQATELLVRKASHEAGRNGSSKIVTIQADVSREDDVAAMFRSAVQCFGSRVLNVNLRGAFLCSREAIRHFLSRKGGGVILNNSSVHEIIPKPKYLPCSVSKGGMENLTKSLALEYAGQGIRVNAVGPGAVITPINSAWINDPKARGEVERHIPMGRAAGAEEIAAVFAFLASDDASYVTGQTIFACGGLTLYPEFRVTWSSGE